MRRKILFLFLAIIFMVATPAMGQSYSDCSQKYLTTEKPILPFGDWSGGAYNRRVVFPWYAVGPTADGGSWETRIVFGYAAVPPPANFKGGWYTLQFKTMSDMPTWATGIDLNVRYATTPNSNWMWGGFLFGGNFSSIGEKLELHVRKFGWWDGWHSESHPLDEVNTGIAILDFWAGVNSDPCVVNKVFDNYAYSQLTFVSRRPDGTVQWQVSEPGYFTDQLSPRWTAPINVSGDLSAQPQDFADFEDPSFAVANAGDAEIRVRISVFDALGAPWESDISKNPCLQRVITLKPLETKGYIIRNFFEEITPQCGGKNPLFNSFVGYGSGFGGRTSGFRGTVLFEAVDASGNVISDAKIIPLVLQRVGDSLTNVQLVKLPPVKPTW